MNERYVVTCLVGYPMRKQDLGTGKRSSSSKKSDWIPREFGVYDRAYGVTLRRFNVHSRRWEALNRRRAETLAAEWNAENGPYPE